MSKVLELKNEVKVILVDEEVVADIQLKQMEYETRAAIVKEFLTEHQLDTDDRALTSPVFTRFQKDMTKARLEWERAKDQMALKLIPDNIKDKVKNWNLNYGTNELTLTI